MQSTHDRSGCLIEIFIGLLFTPAGGALLLQAIATGQRANVAPAERLLSLALFVFCIELAHMASVDLKNVAMLNQQLLNQHLAERTLPQTSARLQKQKPEIDQLPVQSSTAQAPDLRLNRFLIVVISTIVLEATGFYFSLYKIALGALLIICSQLWFNLLAGVQLWPGKSPAIQDFGIKERLPVLVANLLGLALVSLWSVPSLRLFSASGILLLIMLFIAIKYVLLGTQTPQAE